MKFLRLSELEVENLEEILMSEGWSTVLKTIERLARQIELKIVELPRGSSSEELVLAKARGEGARELAKSIVDLKAAYKASKR